MMTGFRGAPEGTETALEAEKGRLNVETWGLLKHLGTGAIYFLLQ